MVIDPTAMRTSCCSCGSEGESGGREGGRSEGGGTALGQSRSYAAASALDLREGRE